MIRFSSLLLEYWWRYTRCEEDLCLDKVLEEKSRSDYKIISFSLINNKDRLSPTPIKKDYNIKKID